MNEIDEEVVVNTTDNAGSGLDTPKLPIKSTLFRRVVDMIEKKKKK